MTVTTGHFRLNDEQRRFVELLERWPSLLPYWDFEKRECDIPTLERRMASMSHGEQILAKFYMDVWLGDDAHRFNLMDAVATLDEQALEIISDWIADPFWP